MQYQNVGVDQEGRLLYVQVPVTETPTQVAPQPIQTPLPQTQQPVAPRRPAKSLFEPFFVIEDGVISLSLKNLTVIGCLLISGSLLSMLYMTCTNGYLDKLDCTERLPMISDVICLPIYDRIFCILTIFYTLGVF